MPGSPKDGLPTPAERVLNAVVERAQPIFVLALLFLIARVLLVPDPILMSDEYYYVKTAQLWSLHEQEVRLITALPGRGEPSFPNSLFFFLYSLPFYFGANFYVAAKLLNAALAALGALAVVSVASKFMERRQAWLVGAVTLCAPATSYLSYFMPEALYDCLVWAGIAAFMALLVPRGLAMASVALGAFLAAAFLSKPDALAIFAASNVIVLVLAVRCYPTSGWIGRALLSLIALDGAFLAAAFVINFATTGHLHWDPLGGFYRNGLSQVATVSGDSSFLHAIALYLSAYSDVLVLCFGPAILVLGASGLHKNRDRLELALAAFAIIGVGTLLLGSVKVGVNWEAVYANHSNVFSTRYMSVLYPLLLITFFRFLPQAYARPVIRRIIGVVLVLLILALGYKFRTIGNSWQMRDNYWPNYLHPALAVVVLIGSVGTVLYYAFRRRPVATLYATALAAVAILAPLALLREDLRIGSEISKRGPVDAARAVSYLVASELRDKGLVVADNTNIASYFMFRYPGIVPLQIAPGDSRLSKDDLAGHPAWVVFLGTARPGFETGCIGLEAATYCPVSGK